MSVGHRGRPRYVGLLFCTAAVVIALMLGFGASMIAGAASPAECSGCHGTEQMLPPGHVPVPGMDAGACGTCHQKGTPLALALSVPLDHVHMLNGITCEACHGVTASPGPLSTEQCLACHGSLEELATRTADVRPHNPHSTPHGPTFAACDLCHKQHSRSENFCAQCHDFEYNVP